MRSSFSGKRNDEILINLIKLNTAALLIGEAVIKTKLEQIKAAEIKNILFCGETRGKMESREKNLCGQSSTPETHM